MRKNRTVCSMAVILSAVLVLGNVPAAVYASELEEQTAVAAESFSEPEYVETEAPDETSVPADAIAAEDSSAEQAESTEMPETAGSEVAPEAENGDAGEAAEPSAEPEVTVEEVLTEPEAAESDAAMEAETDPASDSNDTEPDPLTEEEEKEYDYYYELNHEANVVIEYGYDEDGDGTIDIGELYVGEVREYYLYADKYRADGTYVENATDDVKFTLESELPAGVSATIDGNILTISAGQVSADTDLELVIGCHGSEEAKDGQMSMYFSICTEIYRLELISTLGSPLAGTPLPFEVETYHHLGGEHVLLNDVRYMYKTENCLVKDVTGATISSDQLVDSSRLPVTLYWNKSEENADKDLSITVIAYSADGEYLCELYLPYGQADINNCDISVDQYVEYSGEPVEPSVSVIFEGMQVTDADYSLSCSYDYIKGEGHVTLVGKNAFYGQAEIPFKIIDTRVAAPEITGIQNKENGISLSWSEAAGASGYSVYRNGEKIADRDAAALSFEDTDVSSGETYTYTVCAFRNAENGQTYESEPSGEKTIVYLASPVIASVVNAASASTVTWSEVTGADGYRLYRKTGSGEFEQAAEIAGGSTVKYADKAAKTSGKDYTYYVTAYKTVGEGEEAETFTSADSAQKVSYFVARPAISSIANAATGTTVSWKKITGATGYYLYRKTGSGSYSPAATITSGSTVKYTDTKAKTNGTKYTYYVVAYKTVGKTTYKSANSAAKISYFLTRPAISSASNTAAKTMTVKWKKNAKATGYQVKYVTGSTSKTVTITKNTTLSRVIKSLVKGKTYKVYLRSYKKVSGVNYYSAWSAAKSVKITK